MRRKRLAAAGIAAWVASLTPATAYYHYNHLLPNGTVIQEKFDLNALPNRTLTFFVTVADPDSLQFSGNDSFASIVSQVRQATQAWNAVDTSDLRVAFGGLISQPVNQSTPNGLVIFDDDLPPGWVASSTRTVVDAGPAGNLVAITQSTIRLKRNLLPFPAGTGPSYLEAYYTTLVHEIGHSLGLQHTYTSSAMSEAYTRATSRAKPLDADDIAGLSLLYGDTSSFGVITGRVTSGGQPLHMASVVAIQQNGPAVSAMTNPDGTYRIAGVPPGRYWVYAQALPPSADFQYPTDAFGRSIQPSGAFETLFFRRGTAGTRDPNQFTAIDVSRGGTVTGIDFAPQRKSSVAIYDVTVYSYLGQNREFTVSPAYLSVNSSPGTLAASGTGLLTSGRITTGLNAQILGGSGNIYSTSPFQNWLAMFVTYPSTAPSGPRHILFTLPTDAYVLPCAVTLVQKQPPAITSVNQNGDGTVTVLGSNMNSDSRVFFDGTQAAVRSPFFGSDQLGGITVVPPQGANNQTATVAVYNFDGQNSMFTQSQNPPVYAYGAQDPGAVTVTPAALPAGGSAMVDVNWPNARFQDNPVTLGFGTGDAFVRRVWVLSQTRLIANVSLASNAAPGASLLNVISGFQAVSVPFGFQVQPANPRSPVILLPVSNAAQGQTAIYAGSIVAIQGSNLSLSASGTTVTLNDQPLSVLSAGPAQVNFMVPSGFPAGPAVLRLNNGAEQALPVVVQIDAAPPSVVAVTGGGGLAADANRPAQAGDVLTVLVSNLDPTVAGSVGRLKINVGGVDTPALVVLPMTGQQFMFQAQFILPPAPLGLQIPLKVSVDGGAASLPFFIAIK